MSSSSQSDHPTEGILVRNHFVRGRNVLIAEADFTGLFNEHAAHLNAFSLDVPDWQIEIFQPFLAGFTLHAASRPRNEVLAWTIHFQEPHLNTFLTGDTELSTVAGRTFAEGLRDEDSNMFYQEQVVRGKPLHRSIVPFEGTSPKGTIEFYYAQSEQRPGKFVHLGENRYALVTAHPDFDPVWFRNLADGDVAGLEHTETLAPLETRRYRWFCGCNHGKIVDILANPMRSDPEGLFGNDETITVNCPRCAARYRISREIMEAKIAGGSSGNT